jgi:NAD(P)-dependent dehydrogenase (short-subunit alcohol dehydrogenase family)
MDLDGKTAFVTGAGRKNGMGWAAALRLAEAGANIVVTGYGRKPLGSTLDIGLFGHIAKEYRSEQDARSDLEELGEAIQKLGRTVLVAPLDVRDDAEVRAVATSVAAKFGTIDIIFNNAGFALGAGPLEAITEDQWAASFDVNVMGIVRVCRALIPYTREGGSIINNASVAGLRALPGLPAYSASKFAVIGLTQSMANEFGPRQIRCNAICPGAIHTHLGDLEYAFAAEVNDISIEDATNAVVATIPMGRLGSASDVADVVHFLASDASRYITGAALPVSGGQFL